MIDIYEVCVNEVSKQFRQRARFDKLHGDTLQEICFWVKWGYIRAFMRGRMCVQAFFQCWSFRNLSSNEDVREDHHGEVDALEDSLCVKGHESWTS